MKKIGHIGIIGNMMASTIALELVMRDSIDKHGSAVIVVGSENEDIKVLSGDEMNKIVNENKMFKPEPMILKSYEPIYQYQDTKSGKENRRQRRAKERNKKKGFKW